MDKIYNPVTINKLKKNPHYKDSSLQVEDLRLPENPATEFGELPIHNSELPIHPTEKKKARKNKKQIDK